MHVIQFLLPLRDNARRPFPREAYTRVHRELTERFGGVTAFLQSPAAGAWKEDGGGTAHDELVLYEVMAKELDRAWWAGYRRELEQRFEQQAVMVRALEAESL
jgi:hypothetical protein